MTTSSLNLTTTMTFSEEQSMLLDSAAAFCADESPNSAVRDLLLSDAGFRNETWQQMVELGWLGVAVPEEHGGSGLGLAAVVPLLECMGRHLMGTPLLATQLATQGLLAGGSESQQAEWLPEIVAGKTATVALSEDDGDWQLDTPQLKLTSGKLSGSKTLVLDAANADLIMVSLLHDNLPAIALVPRADLNDSAFTRDVVLDETRRSASIDFTGVAIGNEQLITGPQALAALAAIERTAWLLQAADACGGIHSTIELVSDYLNTRTQFGRKIGSYQALKHPVVDMLTGLERARSHVYHCASLLDADTDIGTDDDQLDIALRMAKITADESYNFAADRAIQFHGGFGFTYECDAQLYLRRALWLQYQFGDAPHHRAALQPLLLSNT